MIFAAILFGITAQSPLQAGLLADLQILRQACMEIHPGFYRYNTPKQMEANFQELEGEFAKAKNLREAYVDLSLFTAKIRCGHTYPNFYNQTRTVVDQVFAGQNRVPFHFRWLGGKMIVTEDLTPGKLIPRGTEIVAIDSIPTSKILAKLMKVVRADGSNDAKRLSILGVDGGDKYEEFDIYLPLMFPVNPGSFDFTIKTVGGPSKKVAAKALSMEDRIQDSQFRSAHPQAAKGGKADDLWSFTYARPKIALLTMPTWEMYNTTWNWQAFLTKSFASLEQSKAETLIIDLRGNEGGNSIGDEIMAYLVDKPTPYNNYKLYTRYEKVSPKLRPYLDTWDRSFDDWSKWTKNPAYNPFGRNTFYRMDRWDDESGSLIQPKMPRFRGKVLVLCDSSNSSATFEFDNAVQSHHLATLIGEPTGGNRRGINGSAFDFLRLPHSGIEVDIPLVGQFPTTPQPDSGLQPDILVVPTPSSIAKGQDVALEKALNLAAASR